MGRKVLILNRAQLGVTYGRVVKTTEHMLMQDYAHEHIDMVTRDKLMRNAAAAEVTGFGYALTTGLGMSVAEGHAIDVQGRSYQTLAPGQAAAVVMPAAHASLPRIDLVYATLIAQQDGENTDLPFRRLRTPAELLAGANPYPISDFNVATRRQDVAVVAVRAGTPNASPVAPAAGANEVPLYHVRVNAAATSLNSGNVTDVRRVMKSLNDALVRIDALEASPAFANFGENVDDRVAALVADSVYLTRVYDDPGNLLTLDVDRAALDPLYVKRAGDTMTGELSIDRGGAAAAPAAGIRGATVQANGGTSPGVTTYGLIAAGRVIGTAGGDPGVVVGMHGIGRHDGGPSNNYPVAYGVIGEVQQQGIPSNPYHYAVYGNANGATGPNQYAGYFNGKVHVTGSLSKGSGTYHIDHPLDPEGKDMIAGFVESSEYLMLYRVSASLVAGAASLDLDDELGFLSETLSLLVGGLGVYGLYSSGPAHVAAEIVATPGAQGDVLTLELQSADAGDASTVNVLLAGYRADPYMGLAPWVHGSTKRLIPERDKPALTAEELATLMPIVELKADGDPLVGTTVDVLVPHMVGKGGFPLYPAVVPGAASPVRPTTYVAASARAAGPALPGAAADDATIGTRPWSNPGNVTGEGGVANFTIGSGGGSSVISHYLMATDFAADPDFEVPAGATPLAVYVEVMRRQTAGQGDQVVVQDVELKLVKGGVVQAANKAHTATDWPATGTALRGSYVFDADDLTDFDADDFNDAGFGVALSARFHDPQGAEIGVAVVDVVHVTVYYTPAE